MTVLKLIRDISSLKAISTPVRRRLRKAAEGGGLPPFFSRPDLSHLHTSDSLLLRQKSIRIFFVSAPVYPTNCMADWYRTFETARNRTFYRKRGVTLASDAEPKHKKITNAGNTHNVAERLNSKAERITVTQQRCWEWC